MNPFAVTGFSVERRVLPLKVPFITALGRKDSTENVLVRARLRGGAAGWGEASGSVVNAALKPARLAADCGALARRLNGRDVRAWNALAGELRTSGRPAPAAAAVESALLDALRNALGLSWSAWFGGAGKSVSTDATLSAAGPAETTEAAGRAAAEGFKVLKVKVGSGFSADLARCLAADAAGRKPEFILDGNQRLGRAGAVRLAEACVKRGLKVVLIEQPVPADDLAGLAWVSKRAPAPVAADESVQGPEDARRVLETGAAAVVNVKLAKMGPAAALETVTVARACGGGLMLGCMQESALGLSPSVGLAMGTGAFAHLDLDSDWLLGAGQPEGSFTRRGPLLTER